MSLRFRLSATPPPRPAIVYDGDLEAAAELKRAGWERVVAREDMPIYSWKWRRPARPGRKSGKLFPSTGRALNALRREKAKP